MNETWFSTYYEATTYAHAVGGEVTGYDNTTRLYRVTEGK